MNIRKLRTWKNSNFFFGWRGPLVIFSGVEAGGPHGVGGRGVARKPGQWGPEGPVGRGGRGVPSQH